MVRNPFLATLIIDYIKNNNRQLPENQSITYKAYLEKTLTDANVKTKLDTYNLTKEEVFDGAILISQEMFERKSLEVPINDLIKKFPLLKLDEIINVLKYSRLGRGNERDDNQFSFVHRRFTEYFYVQYLIRKPELVDVQAIPNDSQMRDALVLYCEVGEFEKVKEIADFCWSIIRDAKEVKDRKVIHSLRFLVDAFRGRMECIQHFNGQLSTYLEEQIFEENDILSIKIVVESVGLLDVDNLNKIVGKVVKYDNFWINEVAIKSCRHLSKISSELEDDLCRHLIFLDYWTLNNHYNEFKFSFSLSDAFKKLRLIAFIKYVDVFTATMYIGLTIHLFYYTKPITLPHFSNYDIFYPPSPIFYVFGLFKKYAWLFFMIFFYKIFKKLLNISIFLSFFIFKKFYSDFYIKNFKHNIYSLLSTLSIGFSVFIGFIFSVFLLNWIKLTFGSIFFYFCFSILIIMTVYYFFNPIIQDFFFFKNNKIDKIRNREEIQKTYLLIKSNFYTENFLKYLENNVDTVNGEWSDNFLKVRRSQYISRIAKLEEKWLKLDN